ncbi:MAG: helix-turn-helix domain-containing protein [Eubacterium sp.]|nr:helix-turn-helix domain-containing protein [Eubacterium sp.]MDD7210473.1 helix-turn-helix transcriptional regulator [Lachnospiraceae bacterium]MDY5497879.1 helix-turn-helix transcriptional regulator [Anaerobutyricum sp.]
MKNNNIARVLKYYRKLNNLSIKDIVCLLEKHDYHVAEKTIYGWESGNTQPSADILMFLCEFYKIHDVLAAFGYRNPREEVSVLPLSIEEISLIQSFREHDSMKPAVKKLLDLPEKEEISLD